MSNFGVVNVNPCTMLVVELGLRITSESSKVGVSIIYRADYGII